MNDSQKSQGRWAAFLLVIIFMVPATVTSQNESIMDSGISTGDDASLSWPPNSNPTQLLITPRNGQTLAQQNADQWHCYDQTCQELQWDPYHAYDTLVAEGYAVALSRREMERGLIFLAIYGAEVGAVAGDLVPGKLGYQGSAARVGASVAVASELIRTQYLLHDESPTTRRVISRYERNLRKWVRKYTTRLRQLGYRID